MKHTSMVKIIFIAITTLVTTYSFGQCSYGLIWNTHDYNVQKSSDHVAKWVTVPGYISNIARVPYSWKGKGGYNQWKREPNYQRLSDLRRDLKEKCHSLAKRYNIDCECGGPELNDICNK